MASITKPAGGKNWIIQFYFQGRKYRKSLKVATRRDALALKSLIERKLAEGSFDPALMLKSSQRITRLSQLIQSWKTYLERRKDLSAGAVYEYEAAAKILLLLVGDMQLASVTRVWVEDELLLLLGEKYSSAATIRSKMTAFRAMFSFAERQGIVVRNPFRGLVPTYQRRKPVFFRDDEIELYRDYWNDLARPKWQQTYFLSLLYTGNRKVEHLKLKWSENVFLDEKVLKFVGKGRKGGKERIVPLSDQAIEVFEDAQRKLGDDRVFWQVKNKFAVNGAWERFRKKTGWPHRLHATRSNYATRLIRAGVPLQDVMDIMGWEDYNTAKIYLGFSPEFVERHRNKGAF